ncbi:MAG: YaeQ family protein [Candidatus Sericytochromatia bacterium]|nr:YaeQ family protein [Candidatus Tanganyikabacteria bacterium]
MKEDGDQEGRFRYRIGRRDQIVLFKKKGESAAHLHLKAIAYALFFRDCQNLQMNPRLDYRVQPDLAAINLEGQPEIWIHCANGRNVEQDLEYICKHVPAREVVLIAEEEDTDLLIERLRKKVHFRYATDKLRVINFHPPVADWLDPENLDVPSDSYTIIEF